MGSAIFRMHESSSTCPVVQSISIFRGSEWMWVIHSEAIPGFPPVRGVFARGDPANHRAPTSLGLDSVTKHVNEYCNIPVNKYSDSHFFSFISSVLLPNEPLRLLFLIRPHAIAIGLPDTRKYLIDLRIRGTIRWTARFDAFGIGRR